MHLILISLDQEFTHILKEEGIDPGFILKFAILKSPETDFIYFHSENKKNIRLNLESSYFVLLSSICLKNHNYINEFAGELIMEMFLHIICHE